MATSKLLLKAGAKCKIPGAGFELIIDHAHDFDIRGEDGTVTLSHALENADCERAQLLLARGVLVTATSKNRETLLHFAAKNGEIRFMKNLVLPEVNLNAQDRGGATALHGAVQSGNEEAVQGLYEAGAIVTLEDRWGWIAGDMLKPYEFLSKRGIYKAVRAARKRQEQNNRAACDHNTGDFIH